MQMKCDDVRIRLIRESLSIQFRFWYVCYANVCMYVCVNFILYIIFSVPFEVGQRSTIFERLFSIHNVVWPDSNWSNANAYEIDY